MTSLAMPNFKRIDAAAAKLNARIGPTVSLDCTVDGNASPVRLVRGDTVTLEPVRWLWPGFLPAAMLTILGGAPGCGKSPPRFG